MVCVCVPGYTCALRVAGEKDRGQIAICYVVLVSMGLYSLLIFFFHSFSGSQTVENLQ
jgi:hypothetical protein